MKLFLPDAQATERLGASLADTLHSRAGVVIHLQGNLGAGKTTLVRGLLRRLGVQGAIRSPTYTLLEPYLVGNKSIVHLDLYRLADPLELSNLGLADYPPERNWWLIEWPQRGAPLLPPADLEVSLEPRDGGRGARLRFATESESTGAVAEALADKLLQE